MEKRKHVLSVNFDEDRSLVKRNNPAARSSLPALNDKVLKKYH